MKWEQVSEITVLCVGDIMLDTFVHGTIDRISPEAPVPILKKHREFSVLGGSGNVVRNLVALGCKTICVGAIGHDAAGEMITEFCEKLPHVTPLFFSEKGRKTPHKTRFLAQGQQILRVDDENAKPINEETTSAILEACARYLPQCHALVLSDYAKGMLTDALCKKLIQEAQYHNIPVIIDPKGHDYSRYRGATIIKPNLKELRDMTHLSAESSDEIAIAAQQLRADAHVSYVLVTRGQDGMTLVSQQSIDHLPTEARQVYDVSGAGDTVLATLSLAWALGQEPLQAAKLANSAAGLAVAKAGTSIVTREELEGTSMEAHKTHSLESLLPIVALWRRQQYRIGFTNGCFDLLHLGHLHILKQAKQACDRLIVGLNTDNSVKRLKGDSRPIQSEHTRAEVLAALENVDAIVLFDDETPLRLIEKILPDVLVKGADYKIDQVVGADIVNAHGGRVVLVDLLPGNSTTSTVSRFSPAA